MQADVLIVGGSAAGLVAGITAKQQHPEADVRIIRREEKVLIPCGIPYIFGTVGSPDNDLIGDAVLDKNGIELTVDEVTAIDRENKKVSTKSGKELSYDRLVLATGSLPAVPPVEGSDLKGVYTVKKDIPYLNEMKERLAESEDVVIIGGGFIGVEFADECRKCGVNVTIVEMLDHVLALTCDEGPSQRIEAALKEAGVNLCCGHLAQRIEGDGEVESVVLDDGRVLDADMVIVGVGVKPNDRLARDAGLAMDREGIVTDEYMQTSDEDIFAAGDCAVKQSFFGSGFQVGRLASIAASEARVAGANLFEKRRKKQGSVGIFSTKVNGVSLAAAGLTENMTEEHGLKVVKGEAAAVNRHPGGMPNPSEVRVKLLFSAYDSTIVGGQITGGDSVGEMINLVGAAVAGKFTAEDIATLQVGTHPALTASPISYQLISAAEDALDRL